VRLSENMALRSARSSSFVVRQGAERRCALRFSRALEELGDSLGLGEGATVGVERNLDSLPGHGSAPLLCPVDKSELEPSSRRMSLAWPRGPCIRVGEFLLPSGLIAIGRDGYIAGRTISPGFAGLAHAGYIQAEAI
jgi:hypothetical protein